MAGHGSQAPALTGKSVSAWKSELDFINGHGNLPDAPSSKAAPENAAPTNTTSTPATKKSTKAKKAADPNETGKLLAAKINQLELDAVEEKDQELEIGSYCAACVFFISSSHVLPSAIAHLVMKHKTLLLHQQFCLFTEHRTD